MAQTLYDLLELSPQASEDAIKAAYERLKNNYLDGKLKSGQLDPDTQFNLIKDAYLTLSKPALREKYDARLNPPSVNEPVIVYAEAESSHFLRYGWKWALVIILAFGTGLYFRAQHKMETERLRLIAEAQKLQQEEAERIKAAQEAQEERQRIREAENRERQEKAEAARMSANLSYESERINRDLATASRQAQREDDRLRQQNEYRARQEESQRRQEAAEAQRRIERERAMARQLEYENRSGSTRAGGISSRH
ncbi:DnaJ domain-containing protein [Uliginosibacterium sp. 31-16]|uniref:DnaJ domain-containing protein n=1 Tax=Uliginosibacterium sp. 31-16 TaxID=3068315 RepID=UPI00273D4EC9|nr:DnaJ domain-containing protein [Uliginosibacterium sp. 31-16]MDP5240748.1 DnaJ domain-containing protein [Uliginosibacterium sp. 31-16]